MLTQRDHCYAQVHRLHAQKAVPIPSKALRLLQDGQKRLHSHGAVRHSQRPHQQEGPSLIDRQEHTQASHRRTGVPGLAQHQPTRPKA